jgi:hypothetical protein
MPMTDQLASTSLVLSIAIAAIAVILGVRQWIERGSRDRDLPEADRRYFAWQDRRRGIGVVVLLIQALGVLVGSRMEPLVPVLRLEPGLRQALRVSVGSWIEPLLAGRGNLRFVAVWLGVILLIPALLLLALSDWLATRRYADRHRRSMARERIEILRQTRRLAGIRRNGPPFGPDTHHH